MEEGSQVGKDNIRQLITTLGPRPGGKKNEENFLLTHLNIDSPVQLRVDWAIREKTRKGEGNRENYLPLDDIAFN